MKDEAGQIRSWMNLAHHYSVKGRGDKMDLAKACKWFHTRYEQNEGTVKKHIDGYLDMQKQAMTNKAELQQVRGECMTLRKKLKFHEERMDLGQKTSPGSSSNR